MCAAFTSARNSASSPLLTVRSSRVHRPWTSLSKNRTKLELERSCLHGADAEIEFRQSQSLVMTPQLMQAIKLLQLSNLDLRPSSRRNWSEIRCWSASDDAEAGCRPSRGHGRIAGPAGPAMARPAPTAEAEDRLPRRDRDRPSIRPSTTVLRDDSRAGRGPRAADAAATALYRMAGRRRPPMTTATISKPLSPPRSRWAATGRAAGGGFPRPPSA